MDFKNCYIQQHYFTPKTINTTVANNDMIVGACTWDEETQDDYCECLLNDFGVTPIWIKQHPDGVFEVINGNNKINAIVNYYNNHKDELTLKYRLFKMKQVPVNIIDYKTPDEFTNILLNKLKKFAE